MTARAPVSTIPLIDISDFLAGGDPGETVDQVRDACERVGFFQVVGHGVPQVALDRVEATIRELAELPAEDLAALECPNGHPFRGVEVYRDADSSGDEQVTVVRLQVCRFDDRLDAEAAGVAPELAGFFVPNIWPSQISNLERDWRACMDHTRSLGHSIMQLFALALDLPRGFFDPVLVLDSTTMSANYYPPQQELSAPGAPKTTFPSHTDSGTLTLLYQTGDYTGLQVQDSNGDWNDVPVVPGAFTINLGDLIARWTGDRWRSTPHRVIAAEEPSRSRVSIPTFYLPALDTVIETFETFKRDGATVYEPVTPFEWEEQFLQRYFAPREKMSTGGQS